MEKLGDELKRRTSEAREDEEETSMSRAVMLIAHDEDAARKLITILPARMRNKSDEGEDSLVVMRLEASLHFDDDESFFMERYRTCGIIPGLLWSGAKIVADWLIQQEVTVTIKATPRSDKGQDWGWTDYELIASW